MSTRINLTNQTDSDEFNDQIETAITTVGGAKDAVANFSEFNTTGGHDHDGSNSRTVEWTNIGNAPSAMTPILHAHGTIGSSTFHSNIGPSDHHNWLSSGYDITPQSVTLTAGGGSAYLRAPDGSTIRLGDTTKGIQWYYNSTPDELRLANWGTDNSSFHILTNISETIIDSPNIYIGTDTSTVHFRKADLSSDYWGVTGGSGAATFASINDVLIATTGITNVSKFNGVVIDGAGALSRIQVTYNGAVQLGHSTHQQNTDVETNSSAFIINKGGGTGQIILSSNVYSAPSNSDSALYNDINGQALVVAGNGMGGTKVVKVDHQLEVEGNTIINGIAFAEASKKLATIDSAGDIKDNYGSKWIQIGQVRIEWGISAAATGWRTVVFPQSFINAPSIGVSCSDSAGADFRTKNISNTGFELKSVTSNGGATAAAMSWMAIGN